MDNGFENVGVVIPGTGGGPTAEYKRGWDAALREAARTQKALQDELDAAQDFIRSAAKHFDHPEESRCKDCTAKLYLYESRHAKSIKEIRLGPAGR